MAKKTWNEKLNDSKDMPKIEEVDCIFAARQGGSKMLLAPPLAYDEIMKSVPGGKLITTDRMRAYLAKKHNADWTCGLTCGIFVNIAANASAERKGEKTEPSNACVRKGEDSEATQPAKEVRETPYWRTLKKDGELNEKYPDGIDGQKLLLEMEGHKVIQKGKRYFVENYDKKLFDLE